MQTYAYKLGIFRIFTKDAEEPVFRAKHGLLWGGLNSVKVIRCFGIS